MLRALRQRWTESVNSVRFPSRARNKPTGGGRKRLQHNLRLEPLEERQLLSINQPPILESIGDQSVVEGETLVFRAKASDPDEQGSLNYDLQWHDPAGMPWNVTFDTSTGVFVWAPEEEHGGGAYCRIQSRC